MFVLWSTLSNYLRFLQYVDLALSDTPVLKAKKATHLPAQQVTFCILRSSRDNGTVCVANVKSMATENYISSLMASVRHTSIE